MEVTISKSNYTFVDVSDWLFRLDGSYENAKYTMWNFAVTLAAGVDQFGRTDARKEELYKLASQQVGLSVGTLKTYASAARSPKAAMAIDKGLTFQHARAVLGLSEGEADDLLDKAVANGWAPETLSREAWIKKQDNAVSQRTLNSQPQPQDATEIDDVPFSHNGHGDDGYVWDTQREQWRHVGQPADYDNLWTDERISNMVQQVAHRHDDIGSDDLWRWVQVVPVSDVERILRTMRDEYEIMLSRH